MVEGVQEVLWVLPTVIGSRDSSGRRLSTTLGIALDTAALSVGSSESDPCSLTGFRSVGYGLALVDNREGRALSSMHRW